MRKMVLTTFLAGVLLFGSYVVVYEPSNIRIERQVIASENLPPLFDGRRIAHLTDFHSWWFGRREKKVLALLEELKPDFVVITGDFVDPLTKLLTDREFKSVRAFWYELGKRYQDRIFGVLGNHDHRPPGLVKVKDLLEESGIKVLSNENKKLWLGDDFIYLIGLDDPWTGRDDLSKAMEGIEANVPKILLAHSPDIISEAAERKIDLVLAGHTHGGQIIIPFLEPFWIPSRYGSKYLSGLFKVNSTYLYVNRGVGTSVLPIRFNSPPEIAIIELRRR